MNRFLDVVPLALTPLTPIHIGCGEDFEPTNYVIDGGVLYHFDPVRLSFSEADRNLLIQSAGRTGDNAIRAVQRFFHDRRQQCRQVSRLLVPVARTVARRYDDRIGQVAQREGGRSTVTNQLEIERTAHHPHTGKPYLPGSSLKGSLRTGWLNELDKGPQVEAGRAPEKGAAAQAERELLGGSFNSDPFRLLDVVDASGPGLKSRVVFAVDRRKQPRFDRDGRPVQKDLFVCCETIGGGQFRGLQGEIRFERPPESQLSGDLPATGKRVGDFATLARACNCFYLVRLNEEMDVLQRLSPGPWLESFRRLIDAMRSRFDQGSMMLVKVGRHSGAESVTLARRRSIQIRGGRGQSHWAREATTMWLAAESESDSAGMQPFGWLLVERADTESAASHILKQWCDEETRRSTSPATSTATGGRLSAPPPADEVVWPKARLQFNKRNGTLTATGPGNAQASALAPRGEEILSGLPQELQQKVRINQFVQVSVRVRGHELVGVAS